MSKAMTPAARAPVDKIAKALSVRQPWAWLIVSGRKTIENRTWKTEYRGPLYIHAGAKMDDTLVSDVARHFNLMIDRADLTYGAIIGRVDLVDIVTRSLSPWFQGPYGWVLHNAEPLTPIPLRGMQGLFDLPIGTLVKQPARV